MFPANFESSMKALAAVIENSPAMKLSKSMEAMAAMMERSPATQMSKHVEAMAAMMEHSPAAQLSKSMVINHRPAIAKIVEIGETINRLGGNQADASVKALLRLRELKS